jgi:c-di-GMP-binding flagellar brake protein YcgR
MADDKRRDARFNTVHLVSYIKCAPEKIPELMGLGSTIDISEGGMRMTTREPLHAGDVLQLEFAIDERVVKTDARVIHVEEVKHYVIGFQFEGADPAEQAKLHEYLLKHQAGPSGGGSNEGI